MASNTLTIGTRTHLAVVVLGGVLASAPAFAQSATYLEDSNLFGTGGAISITRLPIVEPSGKTAYKDATITVTADTNGTLKASVSSQALSPKLRTNVQAGVYARSDHSNYQFRISGPAPLGGGGESRWTIVTVENPACGSPAEFYVGPLDQNPLYDRLKAAGITDTNYDYGIINDGVPEDCGDWAPNYLIGVAPIGSQIEVDLFTNPTTGKDQPTPYERYIYNYVSQ